MGTQQRGAAMSSVENDRSRRLHSQPSAAVDVTNLVEIARGDSEFERRVIETFVHDATHRVRGLEALRVNGDLNTLRRDAHHLRGSCGTIGASMLAAYAMRLEQVATQGDSPAARDIIRRLEGELGRVTDWFTWYLARSA